MEEGLLCRNELVVDVGSACLGHGGCALTVFDHHFQRCDLYAKPDDNEPLHETGVENFPSAAMTVLFQAKELAKWGATRGEWATIWLVSHRDPDFDAYCACYVARRLLEKPGLAEAFGNSGDARKAEDFALLWRDTKRASYLFRNSPAWALFLLAAYAGRVDQCVTDACSRESSLRFLLMAARERGRFDASKPDAYEFLCDVETAISEEGYNPLIDELPRSLADKYAPEVAFIRNQERLYNADMLRARILSVPACAASLPYSQWSRKIRGDETPASKGIPFWQGERLHPFLRHCAMAPPRRRPNLGTANLRKQSWASAAVWTVCWSASRNACSLRTGFARTPGEAPRAKGLSLRE